jgi:hypothetical protein
MSLVPLDERGNRLGYVVSIIEVHYGQSVNKG